MTPLLLLALIFNAAPKPLPIGNERCPPFAQGEARGTWVYKSRGRPLERDDPGGARLLAFTRRHGLTEVYLSIGAAPPEDPGTPALIRKLRMAGLRVEALFDGPDVRGPVGKVIAFNRRQPPCSRFVGVHYDYEPWIGGESSDISWSGPLLALYKEGAAMAAAAGLTFAADISGAKLAQLDGETQGEFARATSWLVLMIYEARVARVHQRALQILSVAPPGARFMLATQVADFGALDRDLAPDGPCRNRRTLDGLESTFKDSAPSSRYRGWATFSYNDYQDGKICPSGSRCCGP